MEDFFNFMFILITGFIVGFFTLTLIIGQEPNYNDGYCEALGAKYTYDVGCIKDDKIVYKFNK